jgi:phosphoribosylformylglycinamidine cyclo-ligase
VSVAERVIAGIASGCREAGCALVGGETAELPGFYADGEYDLAGFSVGVVEKSRRVDGRAIAAGDTLLGLASSGFHSNGYSLVRRVFLDHMRLDLASTPPGLGEPLADALLRPTRIYARALAGLHETGLLRGAAHITGGGLVDNPPRMLPADARLRLRLLVDSWEVPPVFGLLARGGNVSDEEMRRTFNMGLGMLVCVPADRAAEAKALCERAGERVFTVGEVVPADAPDAPVEFTHR